MSDVNKKIDQYVRDKRRRDILSVCMFSIIIVPLLVLFLFPSVGKVAEVEGVIVQFLLVPSEGGDKQYMIVELNSCQNVKAKVYRKPGLKVGDKVVLQKQEPWFFGKTIYRFRYPK